MSQQNKIAVVIPNRSGESPAVTLGTLAGQTLAEWFAVVVYDSDGAGAPATRNRGARAAAGASFLLFSDNDIIWRPDALERLAAPLEANPTLAFSYGPFLLDDKVVERHGAFCVEALRRGNYVSTMSLVRWEWFPGWDESLARLQDWDLWLTVVARGGLGVAVGGEPLFETRSRETGISWPQRGFGEHARVIVEKHRLTEHPQWR